MKQIQLTSIAFQGGISNPMKIFIMYGTSKCMHANRQLNEEVMENWEINLIYAEVLENELNKICSFEVVGPLKKIDGQIMSEQEQFEEVQKHQPNLIIELSVCCKRNGLLKRIKYFIHPLEANKYTLLIPTNAPKEIVILSQLVDELLTDKAQINNYIETERLEYSNMIKISPGNLLSPHGLEGMLQEDVIKNFSMIITAAITSIFIKNEIF